jgi:hypothetical protein
MCVLDLKVVSIPLLYSVVLLINNVPNFFYKDVYNLDVVAADCEMERCLVRIVVSSVI